MTSLERAVLREVASLRPGTTMCPGQLAGRILPDTANPLDALRPTLARLVRAGRVRITQRGKAVAWETLRGPFRVGAPE